MCAPGPITIKKKHFRQTHNTHAHTLTITHTFTPAYTYGVGECVNTRSYTDARMNKYTPHIHSFIQTHMNTHATIHNFAVRHCALTNNNILIYAVKIGTYCRLLSGAAATLTAVERESIYLWNACAYKTT